MDYFLTAQEAQQFGHSTQDVPWLGGDHDSTQHYPVVPIDEYLSVRGYPYAQPNEVINWILSDPDKALPLVQSKMYLGVIESAIADSYSSSGFLKQTPDGQVINTMLLRGLKISWRLRVLGLGVSIEQWRERWKKTFSEAEAMLLHLGALTRGNVSIPDSTESAIDNIIRLSVMLLEHLLLIVPDELQQGPGMPSLMARRTPGMEEQLRGRLLSQGWCPSTYQTLLKISASLHFVEYACCFPATDQSIERHEGCTEEKCIAYNMDVQTAKAKHRQPDCKCVSVAPSFDRIIDATSRDSFPVIDMRVFLAAHRSGIPEYERDALRTYAVRDYREGMKFVAISHVWSDGLIGSSETGLPRCQIHHLANLAYTASTIWAESESDETPWYLWIDALCIPEDSHVRKQAIVKMKQVYSEASLTIVLDEGMYNSQDYRTGYTIMFRFLTCAWSRRLWTLQEAILSKRLYVLFSDGLAELSSIFTDVLQGTDTPLTDEALKSLAELTKLSVEEVRDANEICRKIPSNTIHSLFLRELRGIPYLTGMKLQISQTAQMLALRDSSKREDELLAISPLLGGDVSKLVHLSGEDRVKEFWLQVGAVPKDIAVLEYPKLSTPGFRCLPRTMLGQTIQAPMQWKYDSVQITEKGIRGKYWIYRIQEPTGCTITANGHVVLIDKEARQVLKCRLDEHELRQESRDAVSIDAILLLNEPSDYPNILHRPFRGLGLSMTGSFHDDCEIFSPGRLLSSRATPLLENRDVSQQGQFVVGRIEEVIIS